MVLKAIKKKRICRFRHTSTKLFVVVLFVLSMALTSCTGPLRRNYVQETKAELERLDPFMGDWQGTWRLDDGSDSGPLVARVIALGQGKYRAKFLEEFNVRVPVIALLEGQLKEGSVRFSGPAKYEDTEFTLQTVLEGQKFAGTFQGQDFAGSLVMEKVIRLSPTLGAKPPADAVVLFDGEDLNEWKYSGNKPAPVQWNLVDEAMEVKPGSGSIITKKKFVDVKLHLEFRTPFMPKARGQGRGNSGVYLQGRFEVQVLDSYGLEGRDNECGGIYGVGPPLVNMCAPPMQWQTYDITFRAARFNSSGKKVRDAHMTVVHNGVKIHDKTKVSKATTAAPGGNMTKPGGIYLQDHGNRVQYRNIWLVELPEETASR
ncbi:MAG: 3-keto-disaccharide hydrolase [Planctomycetota bacterium]